MGLQRRIGLLCCLLVGLAWLHFYVVRIQDRFFHGGNDFLQLYAGSRLVGTPELYDAEAAWRIHEQSVGYKLPSVIYTRPPFYAWFLQPLGRLPYQHAYRIFMAANCAAIFWFCWRFLGEQPRVAILVAGFPPLYMAVLGGNDVGLVLGLIGAAVLLMERNRDFAAGLLFSLCAIKFHLLCLLPAVLWILGRPRVLAGGAAGGAALVAISFLAQGLDWPVQYLARLRDPLVHPHGQTMPNLHGLMLNVAPDVGIWATATASLLGAGVVLWLAWRDKTNWKTGIAYALLGGLLVSWHAYAQDAALLLFVLAVQQKAKFSAAVGLPLALVFLPPVFLMLAASSPWSAAPALLMSLVLLGAVAQAAFPARIPTGSPASSSAS